MAAVGVQLTTTTSARASKTWVLPPRAKPGRKSKKDLAAAANASVDDEEAEKVTNRSKQKASRERKQEYIVELEAKVRTYEQGDGERASFFQELAKRYSEERDALKLENEELRRRLSVYEPTGSPAPSVPLITRKASSDLGNRPKRSRVARSGSTASTSSSSSVATPMQAQLTAALPLSDVSDPHHPVVTQAHSSTAYRKADIDYIPASNYLPPSPPTSSDHSHDRTSTSACGSQSGGCGLCDKTSSTQCICEEIGLGTPSEAADLAGPASASVAAVPRAATSCGLCDETASTECICKQMGIDTTEVSKIESNSHAANCGFCDETASTSCLCRDIGIRSPGTPANSQAQALSAASTGLAVPLRSARPPKGLTRPIWRLDNLQPGGASNRPAAAGVALRRNLIKVGSRLPCSGDPRTCPACADDPAGQAFCSALSSTVCSTKPCATCPNRPSPLSQEVTMRASTPTTISSGDQIDRQSLRRRDSSTRDEVPDAMIPCSDAWATLRAHPNIGFANLDLLANVVAKRTHCLGEKQKGSDGKIVEVGREGVEEALDMLDHVRE